ncbi:SAM-dependent methyltransferase [Sinomonas terrae]|uniref:Class I SAM-dependent methyltransferase n=1 Tax=Sinomonas terrae TaxID=2908838 RepID=A0ABS9U5E0_9MICC|nr:class I SAM-dependent methyltransferase [Sinomonas terrae]MCH6471906.1 class I SAM-dependent methyltransferase [Sinomonas terrae]
MDTETTEGPSEFWNSFYSERERVWSGKPNPALVREVETVAPARALDLGCGEGADAIWLAERGWTVTGVDVSAVALSRARQHAEDAGVASRVEWLERDLAEWEPEGEYDLVSAQFLHSPVELPRDRILRRAAETVAPGGLLLVVGHTAFPPWARHRHADEAELPRAEELAMTLGLRAGGWELETVTSEEREVTGPEGQKAVMTDAVLRARRVRAA